MENNFNWSWYYYEVIGRETSKTYFEHEELKQAKGYVKHHAKDTLEKLVICKRYQSSKEIPC